MPTPSNLKALFVPNSYYHFVCKSIDGILLFKSDEDYHIFKERFKKFMTEFLDVWSYCLLPNHTHYIIKVNSSLRIQENLNKFQQENKTTAMLSFLDNIDDELAFDKMIHRQMNSFLVSYANYYNNKYNRQGGLFQKPFRRIWIDDEAYLQQAIIYTNANAQKHKLVESYKNFTHSSYKEIINKEGYYINAKEVIDFFGGINKFIDAHNNQVEYYYKNDWPNSRLE
jgi:putative transposase